MDAGWEELERMAQAAASADAQLASQNPSKEVVDRWRRLFGYAELDAVHLIGEQRADVTRERITDEHWNIVKAEKEAHGYDREAYEHSLRLRKVFQGQTASIPRPGADGEMMLLFRLGGLLDTAEKVMEVADLEDMPPVLDGTSEMGSVKFCAVDQATQRKLEEWLTQRSVLQK